MKTNRGKVLNEIISDLNERLGPENVVNTRTVQRFLHSRDMKRRVVRKRMVVSEVNRKKRLNWCLEKRRLSVDQYWKTVIFSDESQVVVGDDHRVYVWRTARESFLPECTCPPRKRRLSVMIWVPAGRV